MIYTFWQMNPKYIDIDIDSIYTPFVMGSAATPKSRSGKKLAVWIPKALLPYLDRGAEKEDSDRSQFIREAIREKLARQKTKRKK